MTLVIAGHNTNSSMSREGLYVAGDSAITEPRSGGRVTLLGGFRKSYEVPIKVYEPSFNGVYFHDYLYASYQSACFVAFSGGTLTAQHVLNSIFEHLGKLRISHQRKGYGDKGEYCILRHCQSNPLEQRAGIDEWDEEMFSSRDTEGLLTSNVIIEQIEYSIMESLRSAKKYKLDESAFQSLFTEFAAGVYCPVSREHRLFTLRMDRVIGDDGIFEIRIDRQEIMPGDVAVLGMRKQFEDRAKDIARECMVNGVEPAKEMFDFVNDAIDEVQNTGSGQIDRPSYLKIFQYGKLEQVDFRPA